MRFEVHHRFKCSAERLWTIIMDTAYQAQVDQAARLTRTVVEDRQTADGPRRSVRFEPEATLPAAAQRALGTKKLVYLQEQRWRERDLSMKWRVVVEALPDRVRCSGDFKVSPRAGGECERRVTGEVVVNIPLLGARIERRIVDELKDSYGRTADVTRSWITQHTD